MQNQDQIIQATFTIPEECKGMRLDHVLAQLLPEYSRSRLQKWLVGGQIKVNDQICDCKQKVHGGEIIQVAAVLAQEVPWQAQPLPLSIIYEDDALVVINKPIGLVTHPAAGTPDNTLVNALLHHIPGSQHLPRAGIIHRLDKDTSGLLVVAKTLPAHNALTKAMQDRCITREYECIVYGNLISGGTIDEPIGRHPKNRLKQAVTESGKSAITHYRIIEKFTHFTHLKVKLETGRTHQIRVHMAFIDHPIVGDQLYGGRLRIPKHTSPELKQFLLQFKRQALHAKHLQFEHPMTHQLLSFEAPMTQDFKDLLQLLKDNTHADKA